MNLLRSLQTALNNLRVNKLRSVLTMLGVIIGVSAVIIMVALVEGVRAKIVSEFERLGSDLIIIAFEPSSSEKRQTRTVESLTMNDVRAIRADCDLIKAISSEMPFGSGFPARYQGREMEVSASGVEPEYPRLRNVTVAQGRFISQADIDDWSKVCVVGSKVPAEILNGQEPLGLTIEVKGISLTVVGVLASRGKSGSEDPDKAILVPITTAQKRFLGTEAVGVIFAQPTSAAMIEPAMDQVWQCLMRLHKNAPGFHVDSQQNILQAIGRILTLFGLVMGGVAGLALLVGGIGVMNIMLVSVTERTREIGLRKAVGAKRKDILTQFLIESATVTGVGGLIGIGLGAGVAYGIGAITKRVMKGGIGGDPGIPIHLPLWSIIGAFAFSASVGVFFGIYPAIRAARLDPIDALRHE